MSCNPSKFQSIISAQSDIMPHVLVRSMIRFKVIITSRCICAHIYALVKEACTLCV